MTCVTAACASHLILGQKFPKPAQARPGVARAELPFSLLVQGCWQAAVGRRAPGARRWVALCCRTISTAGMLGVMQTGAVAGLCPGRKEGWKILEEERERFWALIGYKSRDVALGLEGDMEAGPKSGPSERKLR